MSEDQFTQLFKYMEKRCDGVDERFAAMETSLPLDLIILKP